MKMFAIFKGEEFLGTLRAFDGLSLKTWASDFYNCPVKLVKIYELVEVK